MFHITIDNRVFAISFKHSEFKDEPKDILLPSGKTKQVIGSTDAFLKEKIGEEYVLWSVATSFCSSTDRFDKARGRKISFERLMNETINTDDNSSVFNKNDEESVRSYRKTFWEAYLSKINMPRKIVKQQELELA